MNRIARSNLSVVAWFTATIAVCVALTGCWGKDIFRPKNDFYGTEKNLTQWRLYCPEPPNPNKVHQLDPNGYYSCYLTGSMVYHFSASLPDNTLYGSFDARIDQISDNAEVNNVHVDWACLWGGGFMAAVTPTDPGSSSSASISVKISNFHSSLTYLKAPNVMIVTSDEFNSIMNEKDHGRAMPILNAVRRHYGLPPLEVK